MSCGSRHYEENPARDARLEAASAERNRVAASKVAHYFVGICGASNVELANDGKHTGADRIFLTVGERLLVHHRGYTISVAAAAPTKVAEQFKRWCRAEMTHVRIKTS